MQHRKFEQNNLLAGINIDREPTTSQKDTLQDAVNMTFNPTDGQKFVYQAIKSTVPKTSFHQNFYDVDEDVVKMQSVPLYTTMSTSYVTMGLGSITLSEVYFNFFGHPDASDSQGKDGYLLKIRIERLSTPGEYEYLQPIDLKYLKAGDVLPVRHENGDPVSMTEPVTKIEYITENFNLLGAELGTFDFFGEVPEDSYFNVGPSSVHTEVEAGNHDYEKDGKYYKVDRKVVLGSKTHGGVTYFIVGSPDFRSTPKLFSNNIGPTPERFWTNEHFPSGSAHDEDFHPEFKEEDDDIMRDRVATTDSEVINYTVENLPRTGVASLNNNNLGWGHHYECKRRSTFVGKVPYAGDYNFTLNTIVEVFKNGRKNEKFIVCARINVVRQNGTYDNYHTRAYHYDLGEIQYFKDRYTHDLSKWDYVHEGKEIKQIASSDVPVPLAGLQKGDEIHVETAIVTYLKGKVKLNQSVAVNCLTTFRDVIKEDSPSDMYRRIGADMLETNIEVVNASTNLHSNGQITFNLGNFNREDGELERQTVGDINFLEVPNEVMGSRNLKWSRAFNARKYLVHFAYAEQPSLGSVPANLNNIPWHYLDKVEGVLMKIDYNNIYSYIYNKEGLGIGDNISYGVWFKVTPITALGAGNYIGGFYMNTVKYTSVYQFPNDPLQRFSVYKADPIEAPVNGSSNSDTGSTAGTLPDPSTENVEYAVDYMSFRKLNPEGMARIHGLSPGTHRLYLKFKDVGEDVYISRDVVVGSDLEFNNLELSAKINMSGTKDITDFSVDVKPNDPANFSSKFHIYASPYKPLTWKDIEGLDYDRNLSHEEIYQDESGVIAIGAGPGQQVSLPITQMMSKSGILYLYAVTKGNRDEVYNGGISYKSGVRIGENSRYYFRVCKASLFIDENYKNNKYNLEVGSFPSPYYGHSKGKLLEAYQPLQNLDGGAFITDKIKLSGNSYVDMEIQPVYDGSVNIIYADGENTPRIINSGFSVLSDSKFELIERLEDKDSNQYTAETVESATRLVQTENSIVSVNIKSVNPSGGNLEVGGHKYLFKLSTVEGNETNFIAETGLIPIFFGDSLGSIHGGDTGKRTTKSIDFELSGVDLSFNHVNVYLELVTGVDSEVRQFYKVDKQFIIPDTGDGNVDISISGFENFIPTDQDSLSIQKSPVTAVKALGQIQNRLFIGNFTEKSIDYNKLIKAAKQILVYPSKGPKEVQFNNVMGAWPGESEDSDLAVISEKFYKTSIDSTLLPDINKIDSTNSEKVNRALRIEGYHNPAFVEKYAAFWPKETYKFNVGFVTHDNLITRPVPVSGGDYIDIVPTPGHNAYENIPEVFDGIRGSIESSEGSDWISSGNVNFNTLGVCRFPGQIHTNDMIFPKFQIDMEAIEKSYPGFSVNFKGFFFTRSRRKPDIIMQGFTGPVIAGLTDKTVIQDEDPEEYVPRVNYLLPEFKVSVPSLYGKLGILAYECVKPDNEGYNWAVQGLFNAGAMVTNVTDTDPGVDNEEYGENAYNSVYTSTDSLKKCWFKSNDIPADFAQAAADFNGRPYGLERVDSICNNAIKQYRILGTILDYKKGQGNIQQPLHELHAIKNLSCSLYPNGDPGYALKSSFRELLKNDIEIVTPDFRPYGVNSRSAGGFSSMVPFRAMGRSYTVTGGDEDTGTDTVHNYLTGAYTAYVGLTSKNDIEPGFFNVYPSKNGPISKSALKSMYSTKEDEQQIAITPNYSFNEFNTNSEKYIYVHGTRGDCFATMNIHNIARSLPAVSGSPSSGNPEYTAAHEGSNEPNSYRASAASMSVMATHLSNNLSYARHTKVVDAKEAAAYGGPRTFLPLSGQPDRLIAVSNNYKMPETEAFNKGYKDNFLGRKYYSISGSAPYYTKKGNNTVAYSGMMSMNSFYNSFRDFNLGASRNYASDYGQIQRIEEFQGNIVLVHSYGVSMVGINQYGEMDTDTGQKMKFSTGQVLAEKPTEISANYGTTFPRSVCATDNTVYGVDIEKGKIWRVNGSQLEMISDNKVESYLKGFTYRMRGKKEIPGERYVATFYNSIKGEVVFTIYDKDTAYPHYNLPLPAHMFYFLDDLYKSGMFYSGDDTVKAEKLLYHWAEEGWVPNSDISGLRREDRVKSVNMFLKMKNEMTPGMESKVNNCLTLVFSERMGTWSTRWSVAPEFMFERKGKMYSISNKQDGQSLPVKPNFLQHYEAAVIAGSLDEADKPSAKVYHEYDVFRPIFWEHEGFNPAIPQYGSFYGKDPIVEFELIFAPEITADKTFESLSIVGTHSVPSQLIYTMSDDNPVLNMMMDKTEFEKYTTWEEIEEAYFKKYGDPNTDPLLKEVANPNMFFVQKVRDRRFNSISRANALYNKQKLDITISKSLTPMYISKDEWSRIRMRLYQDKLLKVRARYESGEEIKINAVNVVYTV